VAVPVGGAPNPGAPGRDSSNRVLGSVGRMLLVVARLMHCPLFRRYRSWLEQYRPRELTRFTGNSKACRPTLVPAFLLTVGPKCRSITIAHADPRSNTVGIWRSRAWHEGLLMSNAWSCLYPSRYTSVTPCLGVVPSWDFSFRWAAGWTTRPPSSGRGTTTRSPRGRRRIRAGSGWIAENRRGVIPRRFPGCLCR